MFPRDAPRSTTERRGTHVRTHSLSLCHKSSHPFLTYHVSYSIFPIPPLFLSFFLLLSFFLSSSSSPSTLSSYLSSFFHSFFVTSSLPTSLPFFSSSPLSIHAFMNPLHLPPILIPQMLPPHSQPSLLFCTSNSSTTIFSPSTSFLSIFLSHTPHFLSFCFSLSHSSLPFFLFFSLTLLTFSVTPFTLPFTFCFQPSIIYHLDVGAMYPNIILTNRLQPSAIVSQQGTYVHTHVFVHVLLLIFGSLILSLVLTLHLPLFPSYLSSLPIYLPNSFPQSPTTIPPLPPALLPSL